MVFVGDISIVNWVYKPTYNVNGGPTLQEAIVKLVYSDATRDACERADYNVPMALTQNSCWDSCDLELGFKHHIVTYYDIF